MRRVAGMECAGWESGDETVNENELKAMDEYVAEVPGAVFQGPSVAAWRACSAYRDEQEKSAVTEIVAIIHDFRSKCVKDKRAASSGAGSRS